MTNWLEGDAWYSGATTGKYWTTETSTEGSSIRVEMRDMEAEHKIQLALSSQAKIRELAREKRVLQFNSKGYARMQYFNKAIAG